MIAELKRLEAAATGGPWVMTGPTFGVRHIHQDPVKWDGRGYQHICTFPADRKGTHHGDMFEANAALIVALRNSAKRTIAVCEAANNRRLYDTKENRLALLDALRALEVPK